RRDRWVAWRRRTPALTRHRQPGGTSSSSAAVPPGCRPRSSSAGRGAPSPSSTPARTGTSAPPASTGSSPATAPPRRSSSPRPAGRSCRRRLAGGRPLGGRRVVAATGLTDELPAVAGLAERWGRDVLHCPYCHGYEVRDRRLAVLAGAAEGAVHQALLLRQWSADVVLLLHEVRPDGLGDEERALLAARGVPIVAGRVASLVAGPDGVTGVRLADGTEVPCGAVFVSPR